MAYHEYVLVLSFWEILQDL